MKKSGFTLAELLVTLGIIGVIAALTLPSLNKNTVEAQIGPKLAKAASAFEQANTALLNAEGVDALSDTNIFTSDTNYVASLGDHMKGVVNGSTITTKDGISYTVSSINSHVSSINPQRVRCATLMIDINGSNTPNASAEDRFFFDVNNDGSARPYGASDRAGNWTNNCPNNQIPTEASYCAGSIFEQNFKVLYK